MLATNGQHLHRNIVVELRYEEGDEDQGSKDQNKAFSFS